ncbi:MAG TPA: hypothetical protein VK607_05715 [Kofleriaceae bacterium]|nr:hypothetical protein [Kofleriaceae bacterium]
MIKQPDPTPETSTSQLARRDRLHRLLFAGAALGTTVGAALLATASHAATVGTTLLTAGHCSGFKEPLCLGE